MKGAFLFLALWELLCRTVSKTFQKQEHLKSLTHIRQIFEAGKTVKSFPVRVVYLPIADTSVNQVAFSVPKKRFKNAVDRNRIKRQLREAYRHHRDEFLTEHQQVYGIVFIYLSNHHSVFSVIEKSMITCLQAIVQNEQAQ